jgi:enoyl-CoA hydratase/carnithine racemase
MISRRFFSSVRKSASSASLGASSSSSNSSSNSTTTSHRSSSLKRWPEDPPSFYGDKRGAQFLMSERALLDAASRILVLNEADTTKNALRVEHLRDMTTYLRKWNADTTATSIVVRPNSLAALSAGLDFSVVVRQPAESLIETVGAMSTLAHVLGSIGKATFVMAPGVVAGAGASLLHGGTCRCVATNTKLSQPEVSFGLVPFGGASYWLAQLTSNPGIGAYVALTGAPLRASDLVQSGIATHHLLDTAFVSDSMTLGWALSSVYVANAKRFLVRVKQCENDELSPGAVMTRHGDALARCFTRDSVPDIVAALRAESDEQSRAWAHATARLIESHCPLATALALRLHRELRGASLLDGLRREYRVLSRLLRRPNALYGVQARYERRSSIEWPSAQLSRSELARTVDELCADRATPDAADDEARRESAVFSWNAIDDLTRASQFVMAEPISPVTPWRAAFAHEIERQARIDRDVHELLSDKARRTTEMYKVCKYNIIFTTTTTTITTCIYISASVFASLLDVRCS